MADTSSDSEWPGTEIAPPNGDYGKLFNVTSRMASNGISWQHWRPSENVIDNRQPADTGGIGDTGVTKEQYDQNLWRMVSGELSPQNMNVLAPSGGTGEGSAMANALGIQDINPGEEPNKYDALRKLLASQ